MDARQVDNAADEVVLVLRVGGRHIEEELGSELIVPPQRPHHVAPQVLEAELHVLPQGTDGIDGAVYLVVAHVEAAIEAALVAELVRQLGVEVIEPIACTEVGVLHHVGALHFACLRVNPHHGGDDEKLGIGAAGRKAEGGLLFDDRPFKVELGGDKADGSVAVQLLVVAVVLCHVKHRTQATAKAGGEAALIERHVLDGIGVEGREEASHVADVVERHTVEQEEVLVGAATTHIHAAVAFAAALHTGHQLQGFDDVGFAEEHRHRLDYLDGHLHSAHLRRPHVTRALGGDGHLVECDALAQTHVEFAVGVEPETKILGFVAHEGDAQVDAVALEGQRVVAVEVGDCPFAAAGVEDGGTDEGLTVFGIGDSAADGVGLSPCAQRQQQEQDEQLTLHVTSLSRSFSAEGGGSRA